MTNKKRLLIAALSLLCLQARAHAAEGESPVRLSGEALADAWLPTRESAGKTFTQLHSMLQLQGDARLAEPLTARAVYQGHFFDGRHSRLTGNRGGTHLEHELQEGWLEYFAGGWQLRAGQLVIPWGKSDGVNPTDFLSGKDSNILSRDSERNRRGGLALLTSFTPNAGSSPWNYTVVVQPRFPEADYLVPPAALPAGITLEEKQRPAMRAENTEVAGKIAYTGEGWDGSLSAFYGWNHKPEFTKLSHAVTLSPAGPAVTARGTRVHRRVKALGADASVSGGDYVYRLETAYTFTENNDGKNPTILPSHWTAVLGAERPFLEKFRAQAQFISRFFPRYTSPRDTTGPDLITAQLNSQVAAANALLLQYQERWETAGTLRLSYDHEALGFSAELLYYQSLNGGDWYLQPLLGYRLYEGLRLYLGADHYGGPGSRSLGSLRTYNSVFTEISYRF